MARDDYHQVKVPAVFWDLIDKIADDWEVFKPNELDLSVSPKAKKATTAREAKGAKADSEASIQRRDHTRIILDMIAASAGRWQYFSYICRQAKHLVFVTEAGDVFYHLDQELKLNAPDLRQIPCILEMKPEKRLDYDRQYSDLASNSQVSISREKWLRQRWILNYFAMRTGAQGETPLEAPLSSGSDPNGEFYKFVDLALPNVDGSLVRREALIGLKDYIQRATGITSSELTKYDRIDLNIDIPTRNFKAMIIIDRNLYGYLKDEELPELDVEFRNREGAPISGEKIIQLQPKRFKANAYHSNKSWRLSPKIRDAKRAEVDAFVSRLRSILNEESDGSNIIHQEHREAVSSLKAPERFLVLEIDWPSPIFGLEVCVRWKKPK